MPPKTEADTHVRVRVQCPHCRAAGQIDASQFDRSFTCGRCGKAFHIGVKQTHKGVREEKHEADPADLQLKLDEPSALNRIVAKVPRAAKIALAAGVALFALWYLVGGLILPKTPLPEALEDRAQLAARWMIERNAKGLQRLGYQCNYVDCLNWVDRGRPASWPKNVRLDESTTFQTKTIATSRSKDPLKTGVQETRTVLITVNVPTLETDRRKEFLTYWTQTAGDLEWRLDVKRTAAAVVDFSR